MKQPFPKLSPDKKIFFCENSGSVVLELVAGSHEQDIVCLLLIMP